MVTFCVVWTGPLTSLRQNFFTSMESPLGEEWLTSFSTLVLLELVWGSCSDPYISLSQCHGHLHELPHSHQAQGPIYDFGSNHDWDHLRVGCGWYDQQQHILIIVFDPWDLEVDLHKPNVQNGRTPCPPLVPITNAGAGSEAQDPHKTGSLCWRPEHPNQSMQLFLAHPLSLGPH